MKFGILIKNLNLLGKLYGLQMKIKNKQSAMTNNMYWSSQETKKGPCKPLAFFKQQPTANKGIKTLYIFIL